jgi:selenocysteine lyase/cysteine desulfurase
MIDPNVRSQFNYPTDLIYLNTGTLGLCPKSAIDAIKAAIDEGEANPGTHLQHDERWAQVKAQAARVVNATPGEIAFTRNTTEGANIVCNGLPFSPGDEIITTNHEHIGNILPWLARAKRDQLAIKVFDLAPSPEEILARIANLLTPNTRALSIPHVSCADGRVLPVQAIGAWARERDLWYFVDGAQAPGMVPVDIRAIDCHAYATSTHKWLLGPKGTGLLYVREDALDLISPTCVGAFSCADAVDPHAANFAFVPSAQRYEYGTLSGALIAGLGAAFTFLDDIGFDSIHSHDLTLANQFRDGLQKLDADILTPRPTHSAITTFRLPNIPYADLQSYLMNEHRIRVRGIYEAGLNAIRISPHLYNTAEEIDLTLKAIEAAKKL